MPKSNPGRSARRPAELAVTRVVARRIVSARGRLGWTQSRLVYALAQTQVSLSRAAVVALEAGANPNQPARALTVDELCALAAALGTTPEALLHGAACGTCQDRPPKGFTCDACGTSSTTPVRRLAARSEPT